MLKLSEKIVGTHSVWLQLVAIAEAFKLSISHSDDQGSKQHLDNLSVQQTEQGAEKTRTV